MVPSSEVWLWSAPQGWWLPSICGNFPDNLWTQVGALWLTLQAKAPRNICQQFYSIKHFNISHESINEDWVVLELTAGFLLSPWKMPLSQISQKRPCPSTNKNVFNFQVLSSLIGKTLVVISWRSHSTHSSFEAFFTHLKSRNVFSFCKRGWTDGWADGEYKIVLQETAREAACSHPSLLVC